MSRFPLAAALLTLLFAPAVAAPVPVDKQGTDLPVPAKTLVVAQLHGVERAKGRLEKMIQAAAPDVAATVAKKFEDALTDAMSDRALTALPPDARVFLAVTAFDAAGGEPPVVVLVPVKDAATLRAKLLTDDERKTWEKDKDGGVATFESHGKAMYAAEVSTGGYVAVSSNKEATAAFAGKFAPLTPAQMGEAVADAFLSADLSVYVNMEQINEDYGDKIRQGRQLLQLVMQQGVGAAGGGLNKPQMEMAKDIFNALFQSTEDSKGLAVGVTVKPAGLGLRIEAGFTGDSPTAKALAGEQPAANAGLADLPAGMTSYSAAKMGPKLAAALARFNQEFRTADDDDKGAEAVAKFNEAAAKAALDGSLGAGSAPGVGLAVLTPADPAAYIAARVKALQGLTAGSAYMNVVLKEKPGVKEAAKKVGGFTLAEARLTLDFDETVKGLPENLRETTIASMKRMISEKMNVWFGTDGKRVVTVSAPDWPAAEKALTEYLAGKNKVGGQPAFRATRSNLPADASLMSMTEVGQMAVALSGSFADLSETIPGLPIGKLPKLKAGTAGAAYLGIAVGLKPTGARIDLFVPAEAVKVVREMLKPVLEKSSD